MRSKDGKSSRVTVDLETSFLSDVTTPPDMTSLIAVSMLMSISITWEAGIYIRNPAVGFGTFGKNTLTIGDPVALETTVFCREVTKARQ